MQGSVLELLQQRDACDAAAWATILPLWNDIQAELGVPEHLRKREPVRVDIVGKRVVFEVCSWVPATTIEKERSASRRVSVPATVLDVGVEEVREILRRDFPLVCSRCGSFHPAGTRRCDSSAKCWGWLSWRPQAPRPRFYVETSGTYGYYQPGPRGLRFVIDLSDYTVFGIQVTLPRSDKWVVPIPEVTADIVRRVGDGVGVDLPDIFTRINTQADPACLAFDLPEWCPEDAPRFRVEMKQSKVRLLSA
jgi:hypothetical protein